MIKSPRIWVYSGDRPSNGAKELAAQEGFLRLRPDRFHKVRQGDTVINWGNSADLNVTWPVLNKPAAIKLATDKKVCLDILSAALLKTPEWTHHQHVAQGWSDAACVVVVRNKLTGHSGDGIVIIEKECQVPAAPLYTKYIFKAHEYRVHVVNGAVIDTAKKIKDPDREVLNWKVRSHDNGFIFARNGVQPSDTRDTLAVGACLALGLDFGAVDIIEDKKGNFYVLEINTAPGLEGLTVTNYAEAFRNACAG